MANEAKIIQGSDVTLVFHLRDENDLPYDLTGATEINVKFPIAASSSALEKKLSLSQVTVVSATLGKISVALSDTNTDALKPGIQQDVEIVIDVGSDRKIAKVARQLSVFAKQFS